MWKFRNLAIMTAAISLAGGAWAQDAPPAQSDGVLLGWLEHALIEPADLKVDAKLDSGAKTSSIHADILRGPREEDEEEEAEEPADDEADESVETLAPGPEAEEVDEIVEDEPKTVVFRLTNEDGESTILEREIVRYVVVKSRNGAPNEERPVVILSVCVAGVLVEGEVNLANRANFNYPFLVGRNMLSKASILIDTRKIYTQEPEPGCGRPDNENE